MDIFFTIKDFEMYSLIKQNLESVIKDETNFIANASNFIALATQDMEDINWFGFYLATQNNLVLGPYWGKVPCIRIPFGKGVCGNSFSSCKSIIVDDVSQYSGYIACDSITKSEIVVPLIKDKQVYGVLDIDSQVIKRFSFNDLVELEDICEMLLKYSNMEALKTYYQL